jgi:hypothetical protein
MSENAPANPDPLASLRHREPPYSAACLADDPDLVRIAHAWAYADVTLKLQDSPPPLGNWREFWEWLWDGCYFDLEDLAERSGLSEHDTRIAFRRLRGLWLIFPDGTLSDTLSAALTAVANRAILEVR